MTFNEYVKVREEKFGSVIFETLREKVFVTNETGKEILEAIQKGYSKEEIASALGASYAEDGDKIKADVENFIAQLRNKGIVN